MPPRSVRGPGFSASLQHPSPFPPAGCCRSRRLAWPNGDVQAKIQFAPGNLRRPWLNAVADPMSRAVARKKARIKLEQHEKVGLRKVSRDQCSLARRPKETP